MFAFWNGRMERPSSSHSSSCTARRTSIRLAPTEKFAPWLPTTRASKFALPSLTAAWSMAKVSCPRAFILEWNSTRPQPSPRSTRDAPGFFLHEAASGLAGGDVHHAGSLGNG